MSTIKSILEEKNETCNFYLPQSGFQVWESGKKKFSSSALDLEYVSMMNIAHFSPRNILNCAIDNKQYKFSRDIYKKADYVFDIGQGDSFSDIYGKRRFINIQSQHITGERFKVPYCLLPQTIGPFDDPECKRKAINSLKYAKCVMVRDKQSYDYVKELCPDISVVEGMDLAFYMPFEREEFDKTKVHVGLNISALLWNGGYTGNNQFNLKADYQELVTSMIDYFMSLDDVVLHLIPHVLGVERGTENDYEVCYEFWNKCKCEKLQLAPLFLDPIIAKNYISGMDFFIGARMHSTIAAFSSGVPVCPMAYSRKFNGLFEDTLDYHYVIDLKKFDNAEALEAILHAYNERGKLKKRIENQNNGIVAERFNIIKNSLINFMGLD